MTCVHKVRWSVKRPEDCRFRLSVSHYKDRIVAPDEYSGATVVTPSDSEQVLPTKDKTVRSDITVNPAPVETLSTTSNGTFTPSDGMVGFSAVTVDVEPLLESLSVTENGLYLPESGVDGFDRVIVNTDIQWDGTLYPVTDETDPLYEQKVFNSKHISVATGDTIIIDAVGRGRWVTGVAGTVDFVPSNTETDYIHSRFYLTALSDGKVILAGYTWSPDGGHSAQNAYCFCGEYLRWKVIHAS